MNQTKLQSPRVKLNPLLSYRDDQERLFTDRFCRGAASYGGAPKPPIRTAKQEAGRKGGLTGGKKRMAALTPEQRSALGKQARESRTAKEALASVEASAKANQLNKVN